MNTQTRIVPRFGIGTPGENTHTMKVTMPTLPWETPSEPKPVTVSKPRDGYAPSVKLPEVAKPRVLSPCRFSQWDEDILAEEWRDLARREGHMAGVPMNSKNIADIGRATAKPRPPLLMRAILRHLMLGDDTRLSIMQAVRGTKGGNFDHVLNRALDCGWVNKYRSPDGWRYSLKGAGYAAFAQMEREAV